MSVIIFSVYTAQPSANMPERSTARSVEGNLAECQPSR